jgi:acyl-coenzyme A thioesterase PaaI-like protein
LTSEATRRGVRVALEGGERFEFAAHNCFACGTLNANGLGMAIHVEPGRSWSELALDRRFEGWDLIAHGGIVTTILDEVMAWSLVGEDNWGVTARIAVAFKRPVPLATLLRGEGWIVRSRRRLVETEARLTDASTGTTLATASGLYVAADSARKRELQQRYGFRRVVPRPGETIGAGG